MRIEREKNKKKWKKRMNGSNCFTFNRILQEFLSTTYFFFFNFLDIDD